MRSLFRGMLAPVARAMALWSLAKCFSEESVSFLLWTLWRLPTVAQPLPAGLDPTLWILLDASTNSYLYNCSETWAAPPPWSCRPQRPFWFGHQALCLWLYYSMSSTSACSRPLVCLIWLCPAILATLCLFFRLCSLEMCQSCPSVTFFGSSHLTLCFCQGSVFSHFVVEASLVIWERLSPLIYLFSIIHPIVIVKTTLNTAFCPFRHFDHFLDFSYLSCLSFLPPATDPIFQQSAATSHRFRYPLTALFQACDLFFDSDIWFISCYFYWILRFSSSYWNQIQSCLFDSLKQLPSELSFLMIFCLLTTYSSFCWFIQSCSSKNLFFSNCLMI